MLFRKAQVSTEYIILIAFLLSVMIPLSFLAFSSYNDSKEGFLIKQAEQAASSIVSEAESIYYQGPPSMTNLKLHFPSNIFSIEINEQELVFRMSTQNGIDDVVIPSRVNLTGNISTTQGAHIINIITNGGNVEISE